MPHAECVRGVHLVPGCVGVPRIQAHTFSCSGTVEVGGAGELGGACCREDRVREGQVLFVLVTRRRTRLVGVTPYLLFREIGAVEMCADNARQTPLWIRAPLLH